MISRKMLESINLQISRELYSAYLYLSMASYFEVETLPGFANWFRIQAQEESCHAMIFFNYVSSRGGRFVPPAVEAPPSDFRSSADIFRRGLEHEKTVTASIYNLVEIAQSDKDFATQRFLDWFVNEQVEEEANFGAILGKLERIKESGEGLFMIDAELGARVFTTPAPLVKAP